MNEFMKNFNQETGYTREATIKVLPLMVRPPTPTPYNLDISFWKKEPYFLSNITTKLLKKLRLCQPTT